MKGCFLQKAIRTTNQNFAIMAIAMVLVLLLASASLAFMQAADFSEGYELPTVDYWGAIWSLALFFPITIKIKLTSGIVIAPVLIVEYLSSHIGEKLFIPGTLNSPIYSWLRVI